MNKFSAVKALGRFKIFWLNDYKIELKKIYFVRNTLKQNKQQLSYFILQTSKYTTFSQF
jgi:hypothetical protein